MCKDGVFQNRPKEKRKHKWPRHPSTEHVVLDNYEVFEAGGGESNDQPEPSQPRAAPGFSWSAGAVGHEDGKCRPCAWNWRDAGCSKGSSCEYCHLCEDGVFQKRTKARMFQSRMKNWRANLSSSGRRMPVSDISLCSEMRRHGGGRQDSRTDGRNFAYRKGCATDALQDLNKLNADQYSTSSPMDFYLSIKSVERLLQDDAGSDCGFGAQDSSTASTDSQLIAVSDGLPRAEAFHEARDHNGLVLHELVSAYSLPR